MKKIFAMLLVAGAVFGLASCSDDKDYSATEMSTINVLESKTSLLAEPDQGYVLVDCNPVKAYVDAADQSWLSVEVKGDSVKFCSTQNESTESRNTLLVIKKSETDSVMLNVLQRGMIFIVENKVNIVQPNDNAKEYFYNVKTDYVGNVVSTPDWVKANFADDRLKVNVDENNEGHLRTGYVVYTSGNYRDSIQVTQYDLQKDILGDYEIWVGYDPIKDTCKDKVQAQLKTNANGAVLLTFDTYYQPTATTTAKITVQFPVTFDADSISLSINSGDQVATYKDKRDRRTYFCTMFASPTGGILPAIDQAGDTIMQNKSGKITAYLRYDKQKGTYGSFSGKAYDEGGYSADFKYLYIGAFSNSTPYKKYLVNDTWWFNLYDMVLVKKEN